ncbi:MAG TPA: flagellar hook-basal body complex protein FliE [Solirubrobacteraceae bacterium]|nr:flagellar hook-basal body complex protein FliE [Solirubrobacteraceae bacterium]
MIIPPVGGLGGGLSVSAAEGLAQNGHAGAGGTAAGGQAGGFGGELTEAISSLEQTQNSASSASQALATGSVSDPETAVVTVEDAQLAMELASQLRNKATEAATSIFNTQV